MAAAARGSALAALAGIVLGALLLNVTDDRPHGSPVPMTAVAVVAPSPLPSPRPRTSPPARRASATLVTQTRPVRGARTLVLTFDDGPDPTWTPQVLRLLDRYQVKAVFCMIGREVEAHPEVARAVARRGHELCDHTYTHDEGLPRRPAKQIDGEIARTAALIKQATGRRPTWFRAPGGSFSPLVDRLAQLRGMTPLGWSDDPRDWSRPGAGRIVVSVMQQARPGYVVLMHDGGGSRAQSLAALRVLLVSLPRHGYRFVLP